MGVKFIGDNGVEREAPTPEVDNIIAIVSGQKSSDRKALAVDILKFITERQAESESLSGVDRCIAAMLLENDVCGLWRLDKPGFNGSTTFHLETVKGQDGERLTKVRREHPPVPVSVATVEEPVPGPVREMPAVPYPVLPPTDTEMLARRGMFASLEERNSDANVALRINAIEEEVAPIRARKAAEEAADWRALVTGTDEPAEPADVRELSTAEKLEKLEIAKANLARLKKALHY